MDPAQLELAVEQALQAALAEGWSLAKSAERQWEVVPVQDERLAGWQSYDVILTDDGKWIIVTHGNSDAGAFTVARMLRRATVVSTAVLVLERWGLSECLAAVFRREEANRSGLT